MCVLGWGNSMCGRGLALFDRELCTRTLMTQTDSSSVICDITWSRNGKTKAEICNNTVRLLYDYYDVIV